ncbi:MAG TPA: adenosylcobinamide-phosphate synthase CbiB [Nitrospiraceae bacterium]|nr:adenosylcobinamide-phosphate synthase CbiB [Nitrospiraceae bacterium]
MTPTILLGACALDLVIGDPRWLPHPVRWIGRLIDRLERLLLATGGHRIVATSAGVAVALAVPGLVYGFVWGLVQGAHQLHPQFGLMVEMVFSFFALAARDLQDHAKAVWQALVGGSLGEARQAVGQIVGRDTASLSESEIVRATVETVAESTSDGIVAPLFFLAVGGAPLAWAYKAVNTLDSVIGHPEPPYRDIGWASARLDDVMNWLPARVTGLLIVAAAGARYLSLARWRQAWVVLRRDGGRHPSPNSGRPEAAMAGALQIQLGGTNVYEGIVKTRPTIGQAGRSLTPQLIPEALSLMWISSALAAGLACWVLW